MRYILFFLFFASANIVIGQQESLNLKISNIQEAKGQIIVSIFKNATDFPVAGKEFKKVIIDVENIPAESQSIHLPKGEYAIALLHDENEDGECNYNMIGIPKEGYGFSQNFKPLFSIPSFDDTKFELDGDQTMVINLIH